MRSNPFFHFFIRSFQKDFIPLSERLRTCPALTRRKLVPVISYQRMASEMNFQTLPKDPSLAESFDVYLCNEYSLPSFAIKFLKEHSSSFEARHDDVYVISYPKTGTTWTQEIMYLLMNNLDCELAKSKSSIYKFPYVEHRMTDIDHVKNMPSPRLLKSHLPYSLLPSDILEKKCKIVYVTRNPRDVAVSYFNFARWLKETQYQGTFDQFFERFIASRCTYSPFTRHNLEFWNHRNDPNILFLFYEDMQMDFASNICKIAALLEQNLTEDDVGKIMEHCSFKSMSQNDGVAPPAGNPEGKDEDFGKFFRKGKVGDWKNCFSDEQVSRMDEWVEQTLNGSGLTFTYEID